MSIISVVMVVCNVENKIVEAMESVLNQSFADFEFIIIDNGSTDNTRSIISSFHDKRIRFSENKQNYVKSLNTGLNSSIGKYVAGMDVNDVMHVDRLKIQHAIMETFWDVTVCSCMEVLCGATIPGIIVKGQMTGLVELPLMKLLLNDTFINPTSFMIRRSFVTANDLSFKNYPYAEFYHFLVETAIRNGSFYIESQPLTYRRVSNEMLSRKQRKTHLQSLKKIKREIISSLCSINNATFPALTSLSNAYYELSNQKLISENDFINQFYNFFTKNKEKLKINEVY